VLVTRDFVFVHLPKTGGSFIAEVCKEHLPVERELPPHTGAVDIPSEYARLPVFALVRNPWDWYVSWWRWNVEHPNDDWPDLFVRDDFAATVRRACLPEGDENWMRSCKEQDWDHYTVIWQRSFRIAQRNGKEIGVGRFENLRGDFLSFLDRHDVPGDALRRAVLRAEPVNSSKRNGYRDYYDDELRDLVGEKARRIVKLYGYEF
jgi:hypothetical protein